MAARSAGIFFSKALAVRFGKRNVFIGGLIGTTVFTASFVLLPPAAVTLMFAAEMARQFVYGFTIPLLWLADRRNRAEGLDLVRLEVELDPRAARMRADEPRDDVGFEGPREPRHAHLRIDALRGESWIDRSIVAELEHFCPSLLERDGEALVLIGHRNCKTTRQTLPFLDRIHRRRGAVDLPLS